MTHAGEMSTKLEGRKDGEKMENRYLFRGKRKDNGEWVFGDLIHSVYKTGDICVRQYESGVYGVDPETVCRFTGWEGIYENDIFECSDERFLIMYDEESLSWEAKSVTDSKCVSLGEFNLKAINLIGNSIDNPEMLKKFVR